MLCDKFGLYVMLTIDSYIIENEILAGWAVFRFATGQVIPQHRISVRDS